VLAHGSRAAHTFISTLRRAVMRPRVTATTPPQAWPLPPENLDLRIAWAFFCEAAAVDSNRNVETALLALYNDARQLSLEGLT
jgi:hypothetical protein